MPIAAPRPISSSISRRPPAFDLDPDMLTIGFARRAAAYKRGDMIFTDPERLLAIGGGKLQLVFGGKAHPRDDLGKELIQRYPQLRQPVRRPIAHASIWPTTTWMSPPG